ncbi:MAG: restriction endonuclease subunit S [Chitinophagales bacterium]|nr:restriction endonuclease subunit S [Chitinophagales bacterium]
MDNWKIKKLGEVCDKISLNKIKIKQKEYLIEGKYPVIDQGQELIGGYFNNEDLLVPNEPPYIIFGDHTKVKKFIPFKFIAGADGVKVLKAKKNVNPKFLYFLLHTIKIENKGYARHFQLLEKESFLFPEDEKVQQAIVSKIEELFSELDQGIAALKKAQEQLKTYRQSVLKWAFEGKLLAIKNEELKIKNQKEGELPEGWEWKKLKDISSDVSDGDHQAPPKSVEGIPFITISNVNKITGKIDFSDTFKVNVEYFKNLKENRKPKIGDVLYTVTGSFGIPIIIDFEKDFCFQRHIGLIRLLPEISQKWLYYLLQSPQIYAQAKETATGTAQKTVALNSLRNFNIPYCSHTEQHLIVQAIESRLSVADKLAENIHESLQKAETLRQSILKQAFEGKLKIGNS